MFGLKKKKGPTQPFTHADDCKIVRADPTVQIEWSEVETGHWEARCVCGAEYFHDPFTEDRGGRLDPYDPSTFLHAAQCEHRDTKDPALLRAILKVRDGAGPGLLVGGMRPLRTRLAGSVLPPSPYALDAASEVNGVATGIEARRPDSPPRLCRWWRIGPMTPGPAGPP